jgi:hypothetical protein
MVTPKLIGPHGERIINTNGKHFGDFCMYNMSIIDYIIENEKIWPYILDTRSYRGAEFDTDYYLLCSKIRLPKKYLRKAKTTKLDKAEKYKIQLLKQPSIRHLHKTRLDKHIKGRTGDINQDWTSLETLITKTTEEVLGPQSKRKPIRLKIWNETLEEAIKSKKETYLRWQSGKKKR